MRRLIQATAALALFAAQTGIATAQSTTPTPAPAPATTTAPTTTPAPATTAAPGTMTAPAAPVKKSGHRRQTLQQRFDAANTTKDGHLTKDQAAAAKWGYVTTNFDAMDKDGQGYVTVDAIRNFAKTHHAMTKKKAPAMTPAPAAAPAPATTPAPKS